MGGLPWLHARAGGPSRATVAGFGATAPSDWRLAVIRRRAFWISIVALLTGPIQSAQAQNNGILAVVKGKVELKRQGWKNFAPTTFGTQVRRGDLLRLSGPSVATVACS